VKNATNITLGVFASAVIGVFYAIIVNTIFDRYMIGYNFGSSLIAGAMFGSFIGLPVSMNFLTSHGWLGTAASAMVMLLVSSTLSPVAVSTLVAPVVVYAAFTQLLLYFSNTDYFSKFEMSVFPTLALGFLIGAGLYLLNTYIGFNAGFKWTGFFLISTLGALCGLATTFTLVIRTMDFRIPS